MVRCSFKINVIFLVILVFILLKLYFKLENGRICICIEGILIMFVSFFYYIYKVYFRVLIK